MAYSTSNPPKKSTESLGGGLESWVYLTTDSAAQAAAVGYFTNGRDLGMAVSDVVTIVSTTTGVTSTHAVSSIAADGSVTITSDTPRLEWRDILGNPVVRASGGNRPTWAQISGSDFWAYRFILTSEIWFTYHVPHDLVPGRDIFFHVHWIPDGVDVNPVKWEFNYTHALGFNQQAFDLSGTIVTAEEAPPGVAHQHMVTESAAVELPELTEPDSIIYVNITRMANGAVDNTDEIFMLEADIHYQSTGRGTLNKAPNFYE